MVLSAVSVAAIALASKDGQKPPDILGHIATFFLAWLPILIPIYAYVMWSAPGSDPDMNMVLGVITFVMTLVMVGMVWEFGVHRKFEQPRPQVSLAFEQTPGNPPQVVPFPQNQPVQFYCSHCGAPMPPMHLFCNKCGARRD